MNSKMHTIPENLIYNTKGYKIQSPEGMVDFLGVNKITKNWYMFLKFTNGSELKCSEDHPIMTIDGIVKAKELTKTEEVITIDGGCFLISKRTIKKKINLFDIVNSGSKHLYYSNGIISHNCDFIGSSNTLISSAKLNALTWKRPLSKTNDGLTIYEEPVKGVSEAAPDHTYYMVVDVARGQGKDYSAFTVIDITKMPYQIVAKYRNNIVSPLLFPSIIRSIGKKYNSAYVMVELNDIGSQVADILHTDLEYENLIKTNMRGRKGQIITEGFGSGGKSQQLGVRTSNVVKKLGCAVLKNLIENDKLIVEDAETIEELTTFIATTSSFKADDGYTDDLVMTLVLFAWSTRQVFFKNLTDNDVRLAMYSEDIQKIEEELLPFGFSDGLDTVEEKEEPWSGETDKWLIRDIRDINPDRFNNSLYGF